MKPLVTAAPSLPRREHGCDADAFEVVAKQGKRAKKSAGRGAAPERVGAAVAGPSKEEEEYDAMPTAASLFIKCGGEPIYGDGVTPSDQTIVGRALAAQKAKTSAKDSARQKRDDEFEQLLSSA